MAQAWPRFLPEPTAQTMADALIIEAYAIIVRLSPEDQGALIAAHRRAEAHARAHYDDDAIRAASEACSAANRGDPALLCPEHFAAKPVPSYPTDNVYPFAAAA
jgi:hypothetical protein